MSSEAALALVEQPGEEKPAFRIQRATDAAAACRAVVLGLAMDIQGKRYLPVEAWTTIAAAHGCVVSIREVIEEERGIRAVAELRRTDNGAVLATAEGFVGLDEPTWANRPLYARRAMSQTRAASRVCRSAFSYVVTLMSAELQTTPYEEIPHGTDRAQPVDAKPSAPGKSSGEKTQATRVRFGKSKGKYLCEIDERDLEWQLAAARKSVEARDPKWGPANEAWLATVEAEVARRAQQ